MPSWLRLKLSSLLSERGGNKIVILYEMHTMLAEKTKRSAITMLVQQKVNHADTAVARTDVVHLLQEVESPGQLDFSGQDLRGINLMNFNLRGANISHARVCEANL